MDLHEDVEPEDIDIVKAGKYLTWSMILLDSGIVNIEAHYSGSGDDGQIDDFYFLKRGQESSDDSVIRDEELLKQIPTLTQVLYTEISDLAYQILENIEDWVNNDGGYGIVKIDLLTGKYKIDNNIYITETETYKHYGRFIDSED